jgi:hypothetical protein
MKPVVKIWFTDFYHRCEEFFRWVLSDRYELVLDSSRPDFLFFSDFGLRHLAFDNCIKIYYTGENLRPDFSKCQFAITFDYIDQPNHYRLPLYVIENYSRWREDKLTDSWEALTAPKPSPSELMKSKKGFCNFIVSNPICENRNQFFRNLSTCKRVDSAGTYLNNMGARLPREKGLFYSSKVEFQRQYKFSIAFENSNHPGYVTEKLLDPMIAHSLPIYWGDPLVHLDFNPKSFIDAAEFRTFEGLVRWVIKVDENDDLYMKYAEQPYLHDNKMNAPMDLSRLLDFFQQVFRNRPGSNSGSSV